MSARKDFEKTAIIENLEHEARAETPSLIHDDGSGVNTARDDKNKLKTRAQNRFLLKELLRKEGIIADEPNSTLALLADDEKSKITKYLERCGTFDYQKLLQQNVFIPHGVPTLWVEKSARRLSDQSSSQHSNEDLVQYGMIHCNKFQVSKEDLEASVLDAFLNTELQAQFVPAKPKTVTTKSITTGFSSHFIKIVSAQKGEVETALLSLETKTGVPLQSVADKANRARGFSSLQRAVIAKSDNAKAALSDHSNNGRGGGDAEIQRLRQHLAEALSTVQTQQQQLVTKDEAAAAALRQQQRRYYALEQQHSETQLLNEELRQQNALLQDMR